MAACLQLGCPPAAARYRIKRLDIGEGDRAIYKTILHMQRLAMGREGVLNPSIRVAAIEAARGAVKNVNEIEYVFRWVKKNIEFRGEHAETLQSPLVTLQLRAGDCDDHALLVATLLRSLGYNARFRTVAANRQFPTQFSHVYVVVQDRHTKQWIPVDTTVRQSYPGWEPPRVTRIKTYQFRGLGDPTVIPPLVPSVAAPAGLTPGQQAIYNLTAPFSQAVASRIAHGATPAATGNLNLGLDVRGPESGLPTWVWLGFAALLFGFVMVRSSR